MKLDNNLLIVADEGDSIPDYIFENIKKVEEKYAQYKCNKCHKIVLRDSEKLWIKSYCEETDQYSRLYRILSQIYDKDGKLCS